MSEQKITTGTRFGAMILDHLIMTMIALIFFIPQMISIFSGAFSITHEPSNPTNFGGVSFFALIGFAVYFCKDCVNGQSIAKRILKLQIVDNTTGQVSSPIKCFVRNIFCILWPIEGIVALTNPSRRIGDYVAGTKLIVFEPTLEQPKINIGQILITLCLAYGLIILVMLPFNLLHSNYTGLKTNAIDSSYNEQASKSMEKIFNDSLGLNLTSDVKVYDKMANENLKYISVIFQLKENILNNDKSFEQLQSKTYDLLFSNYPIGTFVGELQYVYKSNGYMTSTTIPLDWRSMERLTGK